MESILDLDPVWQIAIAAVSGIAALAGVGYYALSGKQGSSRSGQQKTAAKGGKWNKEKKGAATKKQGKDKKKAREATNAAPAKKDLPRKKESKESVANGVSVKKDAANEKKQKDAPTNEKKVKDTTTNEKAKDVPANDKKAKALSANEKKAKATPTNEVPEKKTAGKKAVKAEVPEAPAQKEQSSKKGKKVEAANQEPAKVEAAVVEAERETGQQAKKKKKNAAAKAEVKAEVAEPSTTPVQEPIAKSAGKGKKKAVAAEASAVPEVVPETQSANKKKEKKAKADAKPIAEPVAAPVEPEQSPSAEGGNKKKKKKKTSGQASNVDEEVEDGWEKVPTKASTQKQRKVIKIEETKGELSGTSEATVPIGQHWGAVIGKAGSTINNIQSTTGANIKVVKEKEEAVVTGEPAKVAEAVAMIRSILDTEQHKIDDNKSVEIDIGDRAPAIVGRGGSVINAIRDMSGARLDLKRETGMLVISGLPDQIQLARIEVDKIINPAPPESTVVMSNIDSRSIFAVLGTKGATVREIQENTNAKIDIDRPGQTITLSGNADDVKAAHERVKEVIALNNYTAIVELQSSDIGLVVGVGGQTIRGITTETDARLDIDRDEERAFVRITGLKANVLQAKAMVEKLVNEPPPPPKVANGEVLKEMELGQAVGAVIGSAGANIAKLQASTKAKITIPRGATMCWVVGSQAAVDAAIGELQKIVDRQKAADERRAQAAAEAAAQAAAAASAPVESEAKQNWGDEETWGGSEPDGTTW